MTTIRVPLGEATTEQLLRELLRDVTAQGTTLTGIRKTLTELESTVAGLKETVTELKTAVDGVAQRLLPGVEAQEAAIANLRAALATALADDAQAAALVAEVESATAGIRTEVDRLNALGAEPTTPVDPAPAEPVTPPEVVTPSEPSVPAEPTPAPEPTPEPTPAEPAPAEPTPEPAPADPTRDDGEGPVDDGTGPRVG